jgi:hypothetical protein
MKTLLKILLLTISMTFTSALLSASENKTSDSKEIAGLTIEANTINEFVVIRLELEEEWEYMVFTADGNCIRMGILKKGKNKISLKDMCKGEYIVYLNNGSERFIRKVMQ